MNRESLIDLYNMSHPMKFVGDYALRLRFKFGFAKKVISGKSFSRESIWYLNSYHLENVNSLEILGWFLKIVQTGSMDKQIEKRRSSFYGMRDIDMSYPDLATDAKPYI